jgi:phage-related protein
VGWTALGKVISAALGVVKNTLDMVGNLTGDKFPNLAANQSLMETRLAGLIGSAKALANIANTTVGTWNIEVAAGWTALGKVIADALGIVKNALDLAASLMGDKFPDLAANQALMETRLRTVLKIAKDLAGIANRAIGTWSVEVAPGWDALGKVMSNALGVVKNTLDMAASLIGDKFPNLAANQSVMETRLGAVLTSAKALAQLANTAITGWNVEVAAGWDALGKVISAALGIVKNTLDLAASLSGDKFPDLAANKAAIETRLGQVLTTAKDLALLANRAIAGWNVEVAAGWDALGKVISNALGVVKNTLDLVSTLGGKDFPDLSGGVLDTLKDRLKVIIEAGQKLAQRANETMGTWNLEVSPGFEALGKVMSDSLGILKSVLEFSGLRAAIVSFKPLGDVFGRLEDEVDLWPVGRHVQRLEARQRCA